MNQLLFGLTVAFSLYVIYEVFKTVSQTAGLLPAGTESGEPPAAAPTAETTEAPSAPSAAPSAEKGESAVPAAASETDPGDRAGQLRNPQTGELSAIPTNYRFAKKWIKEALVAEHLLDRIYKPNELDEANTQKVKEALDQFKSLAKYQS